MKSTTHRRHGNSAWLLAVILTGRVFGAEPTPIRLAVGPFFAPEGNQRLREVSVMLPDLLTAELSRQGRFELVERDKVSAILNELNLTAEGLTSSETVSKLGQMLACDRLVSGSFVVSETRTQVWAKIIDTRSSVVLDLEVVPYESTNLSATLTSLATFLSKAVSRPQVRQFIALGRFVDVSVSGTREDWSRRLRAVIEKHFHETGFGVVEREAVRPILEEFQLEGAGLTGSYSNRVKLQPAFWFVDGGCKWVRDTQDKVSVALRIQKVGGKEVVLRLTGLPGHELERAVLETIQTALANTNQIVTEKAALEEGSVQFERAMELAARNAPLPPPRYSSNPDLEEKAKLQENRLSALEGFEKALLLDPKNVGAKRMLAYGLVHDEDLAQRERGTNLMREIAASDLPALAAWAKEQLGASAPKKTLTPLEVNQQILLGDPSNTEARINVAYLLQFSQEPEQRKRGTNMLLEFAASEDPVLASQATRRLLTTSPSNNSPKKVGDSASVDSIIKLETPNQASDFPLMTAANSGTDEILVASGTRLFRHDLSNGETGEMKLPFALGHTITTIAIDKGNWWLGTEGGGLVKISKNGQSYRIFDEKDGFPMQSIQSSCRFADRLWLGFGFRASGGFGYLDVSTEKFVGMSAKINTFKSREEMLEGPPGQTVTAIKTADEKTLWVATSDSVRRFDIASGKWSPMLRMGPTPGVLTVKTNYLATSAQEGGVLVCELATGRWKRIDFSRRVFENRVSSLRSDGQFLWVGQQGELKLVDVQTLRVIGACKFFEGSVRWICPTESAVVFVADSLDRTRSSLYWFRKPSEVLQSASPHP